MAKVCLLALFAALVACSLLAAVAEARPARDGPRRANQRLHVHHSRAGRSNLRRDKAAKPTSFDVAIDDSTTLEVELDEESVPSAVQVMVDDGRNVRPHSAPAADDGTPRVFRGHVKGKPNSHVSAVVQPNGSVQASVDVDGKEYFVAPIGSDERDGDDDSDQVVFTREDIEADPTKTCAAKLPDRRDVEAESPDFLNGAQRLVINDTHGAIRERRATCTAAICQADLVVDVDYEYYVSRGSNVNKVVADVTAVIDQVNIQYQRDVGITHRLTSILVRTTSNDPYTSTDAVKMLDEMDAYWSQLSGSYNPPRDLVQLFTGKNIDGGTIGIAWMSVVCSSRWIYSVVQSDFYRNGQPYPQASDLTAHELGHNWGSGHCSCANPPSTMNPYITSSNRFDANVAIPSITNLRNRGSCLVPYSATPSTQAPTTQAPTTRAPTTQAPTTQAPTTQRPTTQAVTTQRPTTQAPTTQRPTTQAPTTQAPTTRLPTTQAPTTCPVGCMPTPTSSCRSTGRKCRKDSQCCTGNCYRRRCRESNSNCPDGCVPYQAPNCRATKKKCRKDSQCCSGNCSRRRCV